MWDMVVKGGPVMVPIIGAGILAFAIFFERMVALRRERVIPSRLVEAVLRLTQEARRSEAQVLCEQDRAAISAVLLTGLRHQGKARPRLKELMEETGKSVVSDLERFVHAIGTIAAISPLLGLLGTVTGMIKMFMTIEATETIGDPKLLAAGIWEALITTAGGLIVAIPAFMAYRFLLSKVDRLVLEMEEVALRLADFLALDASDER